MGAHELNSDLLMCDDATSERLGVEHERGPLFAQVVRFVPRKFFGRIVERLWRRCGCACAGRRGFVSHHGLPATDWGIQGPAT
jgi:hypothetical protein